MENQVQSKVQYVLQDTKKYTDHFSVQFTWGGEGIFSFIIRQLFQLCVYTRVYSWVYTTVYSIVYITVYSTVYSTVYIIVYSTIYSTVYSRVYHKVYSKVYSKYTVQYTVHYTSLCKMYFYYSVNKSI